MPGVSVGLSGDMDAVTVVSPFLPGPEAFVTGDRGAILADGHFTLAGRSDRIVKLEERRVSLFEIEERLRARLEVAEVRVVALTAARKRVAVGAAVVPSEPGWVILRAGGKRALREILQTALKPHLEALALPRKWRFVRRLPETAQGKTADADVAEIFAPAMGRLVDPEILDCKAEGARVGISLALPPGLFYFDGHFDVAPILPGVVQVDWALAQARAHFDLAGNFHRIEALKFFKVLPAGAQVELELEFDAAKRRLTFTYRCGDVTHSAGRIKFEPAP
jgi:3-hydroxymyristoyl/3-hydroxydecanoyl-(acyl carrier protein) dehydratase